MARKSRKPVQVQETAIKECSSSTERIYKAGLYARISVENERKRESDTIGTQIQLLKDFASERDDIKVVDVYCDDDISGTDFLRPEFSRMMNDAREGRIDCIIVKDLSRLGRNYLETGEYIEMVFPFMGLRFVAITDQFDTKYQQADIAVQIKNMANEMYARDISKKICSGKKNFQQQGKFAGSRAPYGYLIDPDDKQHLVIDPETADVVLEMFNMVAGGYTLHRVAVMLNEKGVPSPGRRMYDLGSTTSDKFKNSKWVMQTVSRILQNQVYLGWMVGGRYRSDYYISGQKDCKPVPQDEWIIVKGTHEPIVTEELFNQVQKYFEDNKRKSGLSSKVEAKGKRNNLFKGKLRCGECGHAMNLRNKNTHGNRTEWYICYMHEHYNSSYCPKKGIKRTDLDSTALRLIQSQIQLLTDAQETFRQLNQQPASKTRYRIYQDQIRDVRKQIERYMEQKAALYQKYVDLDISEQEFMVQAEELSAKADELRIFLAELEKNAQKYSTEYAGSSYWNAQIRRFKECTELSAEMVDAFIDTMTLYNDGHVEVKFKYRDEMEHLLSLIALRRREVGKYAV